jgi:hypothetical protein
MKVTKRQLKQIIKEELEAVIESSMPAQYDDGPGAPRIVDGWVPLIQTLRKGIKAGMHISQNGGEALWDTIVAPTKDGARQRRNDFSHVTNVEKYIGDITNIINGLTSGHSITQEFKDELLGLLPKHKEFVAAQVGMSADDRPQIKMPSATKSPPKKPREPIEMPSHFEYFESIDRDELKKAIQEELGTRERITRKVIDVRRKRR